MNKSNQNAEQQGGYFGYAPSGWQRSDEFIEDAVCTRMANDNSLDATGIQVEVSEGQVTLSGHVSSPKARKTAHNIVLGVYGVKNLEDKLEIGVRTPAATQTAGSGASTSRSRG